MQFNRKLRDELLNREVPTTLIEARVLMDPWRCGYEEFGPHCAIHYQPPTPGAIRVAALASQMLSLARAGQSALNAKTEIGEYGRQLPG